MNYFYTLLFLLIVSVPAQAQNALHFDGNDDVVQSNYAGPLGTTNRTFEAWVYVDPSAPASNLCILDYGLNAVGSRNTFNVSGTRALSFISGGTNANISSSPNDVPVGQWAHVAFTLNNGTGFFYVNGVQVGTGNLSSVNTPSGNANVKIGERVSGGSIPFYGIIDEVKVWDIARTEAQILASFNDEVCNTDANLNLYYRFNEGTANGTNGGINQAVDDSGNGYNGVLSGFALNGTSSNWTNGVALTPGSSSATFQADACDTYTWSTNGQTYTTSGVYTEVLTGSTGCDSILNLDLTIYSPNNLTTTQVSCDSFTWNVNGQTYTSSDTIVENLTTSQGCSYQHTLNLTINQGFDSVQNVDACNPYIWPVTGLSYTISGAYTETFTDVNGCDSTYTMYLFLTPVITASITDNGDGTLSASPSGETFLYDCIADSVVASSGSNFVFTPTYNSSYAAITTDWGFACPDTSNCIVVDYVSTPGLDPLNHGITLEPNPTDGDFEIAVDGMHGVLVFEIIDASGKVIQEVKIEGGTIAKMTLDAESGVYMVRALTEFGWYTERIVKF
ncbi:T9SS type A sorting domain-containing protein [Crocinitomicaceae bacterium]|nr:T9SS type A sorting domain-containing protein [Crocinitomicaceae bacterium]